MNISLASFSCVALGSPCSVLPFPLEDEEGAAVAVLDLCGVKLMVSAFLTLYIENRFRTFQLLKQ